MEGNRDNRRLCFCITSLLEQNVNNGEMLKVGDRARKMVKDAIFLSNELDFTRTSAVLVF